MPTKIYQEWYELFYGWVRPPPPRFIKIVGGQTFWFWVGSLSYQKKEGMKFISGSFDLRLRQGLESLHAKILDSYTSNSKNP